MIYDSDWHRTGSEASADVGYTESSGEKLMPARSAGILLYRFKGGRVEVLLVHPGGPFWRKKDLGAWQIPKGLIELGEDNQVAARREVAEELGTQIDGPLVALGEIRQAGGKVVVAFAAEHDIDAAAVISNMIEIEWPPRTGRKFAVPEVDEARWFSLDEARRYMLESQAPLLDRLTLALSDAAAADTSSVRDVSHTNHSAASRWTVTAWEMTMTELTAEERNELDKESFAFPKERKEPLKNASHVRNAIARFKQVKGVTDEERDAAWKRIETAAKKHGVEVNEKSWREIGKS